MLTSYDTFALWVYGRVANIITIGKNIDIRRHEKDKVRQNKHKLLKRLRLGIFHEW